MLKQFETVFLEEGFETDNGLFGIAHNDDVLHIFTIDAKVTRPVARLGMRLERALGTSGNRVPSFQQLFVGLVRSLLELGPGYLGVNVLEVGIAPGAELVKDIVEGKADDMVQQIQMLVVHEFEDREHEIIDQIGDKVTETLKWRNELCQQI